MATAAVVMATTMTSSVVKYGCFNTMLEMGCVNKHVLVFDSARYGRNNTAVSIPPPSIVLSLILATYMCYWYRRYRY